MEYLSLIATVFVINLLAAMSPGPDFVMIVRNSLTYSRKIGIYSSIGVGLGLTVHITYCAIGIALLISKSPVVFSIIKYAGAAYLIYMGVGSIFSKVSKIQFEGSSVKNKISIWGAFRTGFLTNVLNPKATLFFFGLFTFVVSPKVPALIILIIAVIVVLTAIAWFTLVSIFFTQKAVKETFFKFEKKINIVLGCLLIFLAIKIALMSL